MTRCDRLPLLVFLLLVAPMLVLAAACGDDDGSNPGADADTTVQSDGDASEQDDADVSDPDVDDTAEEDTVEPIYPGNPCETDEECSTGLCYGAATKQGAFEPAECQLACLQPLDWDSYCNSDTDCCGNNSCCLGCGEQEGLCLITAP